MVWYYFLNPRVEELSFDFDDATNLILSSKVVPSGSQAYQVQREAWEFAIIHLRMLLDAAQSHGKVLRDPRTKRNRLAIEMNLDRQSVLYRALIACDSFLKADEFFI